MDKNVITEVEIVPVRPRNGLVAFANLVFEGNLAINGIGIHTCLSRGGYRLVYPSKILPNGKSIQTCYPISRQTADLIQLAVVEKYNEILGKIKM